ncbi:hypothetical protein [Spiroplasma endosymbiont of Polydrusus formosus]|uniref:hypothetical protein n=1 Tax=Spiroplasma endosymbiont of Polydrusus formosus TaxID=3139326 RepID=UPI0035B50C70
MKTGIVFFDRKTLLKKGFVWCKIVFPSGIRITFAGYANGNKIMEKLVKAVVLSQLELMKWSTPKKKKS